MSEELVLTQLEALVSGMSTTEMDHAVTKLQELRRLKMKRVLKNVSPQDVEKIRELFYEIKEEEQEFDLLLPVQVKVSIFAAPNDSEPSLCFSAEDGEDVVDLNQYISQKELLKKSEIKKYWQKKQKQLNAYHELMTELCGKYKITQTQLVDLIYDNEE